MMSNASKTENWGETTRPDWDQTKNNTSGTVTSFIGIDQIQWSLYKLLQTQDITYVRHWLLAALVHQKEDLGE
jgi:hypothetical protein